MTTDPTTDPRAPKSATATTRRVHAALAARLPFHDDADFARAERGLLRRTGEAEALPVEAPETVNPSLWRQARLNALDGLYEVTGGVYQVRGYDLANVTFIRGARGWVVVDPLTAAETAAAALRTLREHFADERPVTAVVYTHCHAVAEVVNHVVFADPANQEARWLQADTLEQLGYQAESGPWRDFYLTGAQELRQGTPHAPGLRVPVQPDVLRGMPGSMLLDFLAVRLDGPRAATRSLRLALHLTDAGSTHLVELSHGTLHHSVVDGAPQAVGLDRVTLARLADDPSLLDAALTDGSVTAPDGGADDLRELLRLLVSFDLFFPVIEP